MQRSELNKVHKLVASSCPRCQQGLFSHVWIDYGCWFYIKHIKVLTNTQKNIGSIFLSGRRFSVQLRIKVVVFLEYPAVNLQSAKFQIKES